MLTNRSNQEDVRYSPLDFAKRHCRDRGISAVAHEATTAALRESTEKVWDPDNAEKVPAREGQQFERDGVTYVWQTTMHVPNPRWGRDKSGEAVRIEEKVPVTYREYYQHDTTGGIAGVGWDRRRTLTDEDTWLYHGRVFDRRYWFSWEDEDFPDEPMLEAVPLDSLKDQE